MHAFIVISKQTNTTVSAFSSQESAQKWIGSCEEIHDFYINQVFVEM